MYQKKNSSGATLGLETDVTPVTTNIFILTIYIYVKVRHERITHYNLPWSTLVSLVLFLSFFFSLSISPLFCKPEPVRDSFFELDFLRCRIGLQNSICKKNNKSNDKMHEQLKDVHNNVNLHSVDKKQITTIIKLEFLNFPSFQNFNASLEKWFQNCS